MQFVLDPRAAAEWYACVLEHDGAVMVADGGFAHFELAGVEFGFHPADEQRNPPGASTVCYLSVASVETAMQAMIAAGATLHRGPLAISDARAICQLRDPFGGIFGIDGPA